jgi:hypothetical protein
MAALLLWSSEEGCTQTLPQTQWHERPGCHLSHGVVLGLSDLT